MVFLRKLSLNGFCVDIESSQELVSLPFVEELHLMNFRFIDGKFRTYDPSFDLNSFVNLFCRFLSSIFPNLTVFNYTIHESLLWRTDNKEKICKAIQDNSHCFKYLKLSRQS